MTLSGTDAKATQAPYESCADQKIDGLYIHDPKTCFHCMLITDRQMQKPTVRWSFHRHRNVWSFRAGSQSALSSGEVVDDSLIRAMFGDRWVQ